MVAEFAAEHTARVSYLLAGLNGEAPAMPLVRCPIPTLTHPSGSPFRRQMDAAQL